MRNASGVAALRAAAFLALVPLVTAADATPVGAMASRLRLLPFSDALADRQTTVVNPRITDRDGLNGGEIAGIVIGSVAALLLLLGIIYLAFALSRPPKAKKGAKAPDTCEGGTKTWGPHGGGWTSMWSFAAPSAPPPPPPLPMHCPPHGGGGHGVNPCPPGFVPAPCPPPRVAKPGSSIWRVPFRPPFGGRGGGGGCGGRSCGLAPCVCCVVCCASPCRCMMGGMRCGTCRQGRGSCRCGGRGRGGVRSAVTCKTCRMAPCSCTDCRR